MDETKPQTTKEKLKAIFPQGFNPPKPAEAVEPTLYLSYVSCMNTFREWYDEDIPVKKNFLGIAKDPTVTFWEYAHYLAFSLASGWRNQILKNVTTTTLELINKFDAIVQGKKEVPLKEILQFLVVVEPDINQWGPAVRKNALMDLKEAKKI